MDISPATQSSPNASELAAASASGPAALYRICLVPQPDDSGRAPLFDTITRDLRAGSFSAPLRIGRCVGAQAKYGTDADSLSASVYCVNTVASAWSSNGNGDGEPRPMLLFRSKVLSRAHAEIWVEGPGTGRTASSGHGNGDEDEDEGEDRRDSVDRDEDLRLEARWFIRDTKSSSGTWVNSVRLSEANEASDARELRDGDVVQLGRDYQGGVGKEYRCVRMRVELMDEGGVIQRSERQMSVGEGSKVARL